MLTAFTSQDGTLRPIAEPLSTDLWIDLVEPTSDEIAQTGLDIPTEADIDEIESSGRLVTRDGTLYLGLPFVTRPETEPGSVRWELSCREIVLSRSASR